MNIAYNTLSMGKHYILTSIINNNKNERFFNQMDSLLVKKRFDIAAELSLTENILHISTYKLTGKNILKIVNDFIKSVKKSNFYGERNLFEIVKLSNLPEDKLDKIISQELHLELISLFSNVSRETKLISFDFLILKIADNFALKNKNNTIKNAYKALAKDIIRKILNSQYNEEKDEKETIRLCWVDRILYAIINKEISPDEFISITKKILKTTPLNISLQWKVLHAVNYILLQSEFSTSSVLKNFKKSLNDSIEMLYNNVNLKLNELQDLVVTILAKRNSNKEDFYYLFDVIELIAKKDENSRLYCLLLCKYIINNNRKQNIFHFRFVREYFMKMLFKIINNPNENIKIKEEELEILLSIFHVDSFYSFFKVSIFNKIVEILQTINNGKTKLNNKNFYRYCDVLDYIMSKNEGIGKNIIKNLSITSEDELKIKKYFTLSIAS